MKILHLIISILILLILIGCSKPVTVIDNYYITNITNKKIIHQLELRDYELGNKVLSIYIDKYCKDSLEWMVVAEKKATKPVIGYRYTYIYNISDTTSINIFYIYIKSRYPPWDFLQHFYYYKQKRESSKLISDYHLVVNDSFLTFFQKDTSMLTKFKDYYNP